MFTASLTSVHFHLMLMLIFCNVYLLLCENGEYKSIYLLTWCKHVWIKMQGETMPIVLAHIVSL